MRKYYLLSLFSTLLIGTTLQAQIEYTDIQDGVPTGIDFNNDGTFEFEISNGNATGDYITYMNGGADNNIFANGDANDGWDVPKCVASGFMIDASGNWIGAGDCAVNGWGTANPTITIGSDEYLAVRFNLSGSAVYYGWIRFSMDSNGNITYKDYAYNTVAGKGILAGDKGSSSGIEASDLKLITIYPNPTSSTITFENKSKIQVNKLSISSILGKEVLILNLNKNTQSINVSQLKEGVYFVKLLLNNKILATKRIIIR